MFKRWKEKKKRDAFEKRHAVQTAFNTSESMQRAKEYQTRIYATYAKNSD